jgi:hypothetical protein
MAATARRRLLEHVQELYAAEQARYHAALAGVVDISSQARRLASAAAAVKAVR